MAPISSLSPEQTADSPLALSCQLLLVIANDWESSIADLRRFERERPCSDWRPIGNTITVSLGKSGLAWGVGLHREVSGEVPSKHEGDRCAPAGVFAITTLFGYADQESEIARSAKLPYISATRDIKCIDDPMSRYYNQIVDQSSLTKIDWISHEEMLRSDDRYTVGAVIAHNSYLSKPCAGSCIFIHVWQSEGVPTAGCTAGSLADISEICHWLDGAASPVLVQLPQSAYARFKDVWALPSLAD